MKDDSLTFDAVDVYDSFQYERLVFFNEGDREVFICEDNTALSLSGIESFVVRCGSTKGFGFSIDRDAIRAGSFASDFHDMDAWMSVFDPRKKYSPNVEVFFSVAVEVQWLDTTPVREYRGSLDKRILIVFNELLELIRVKLKSTEYKRKVTQVNRKLKDNYDTCNRKIDLAFNSYSRMLVLRVDFGFRTHVDLSLAKKFLDKFLNNRRSNNIFKDEIGYIWSLEHGERKGYHYHCFFFFNGALVDNDAFRVQLIGEYWRKITEGVGVFYNCNRNKSQYKHLAIGKMEHFDETMRGNLRTTLSYFFKKEQLLSIRFDSAVVRTFAISFKKRTPSKYTGRPRNNVALDI